MAFSADVTAEKALQGESAEGMLWERVCEDSQEI